MFSIQLGFFPILPIETPNHKAIPLACWRQNFQYQGGPAVPALPVLPAEDVQSHQRQRVPPLKSLKLGGSAAKSHAQRTKKSTKILKQIGNRTITGPNHMRSCYRGPKSHSDKLQITLWHFEDIRVSQISQMDKMLSYSKVNHTTSTNLPFAIIPPFPFRPPRPLQGRSAPKDTPNVGYRGIFHLPDMQIQDLSSLPVSCVPRWKLGAC